METKVVFETASFADAISRAARVAPNAGSSQEKSPGIVLEIYPVDNVVIVKATDIAIFYTEWVDPLSIEGKETIWQCPAALLGAFVASLPIGSGKSLTLESTGNQLSLTSGRTKAKFSLITYDGSYPQWGPFEESDMTAIPDLGERIKQVEWAASKKEAQLGLRLDGEHLIATDRYRFAQVPLKVDVLDQPITIPPKVLQGLLKNIGDTKIKVSGRSLLVTPDDRSQARTVIIDLPFPNAERVYANVYPESIELEKTKLIDAIGRVSAIGGNNPFPSIKIIIGQQELACFMSDDELGHIGDVIELPNQCEHDRCDLMVGPNFIKDALAHSPTEMITLHYKPWPIADIVHAPPILISGGSGYKVWIMQRAEPQKGSD